MANQACVTQQKYDLLAKSAADKERQLKGEIEKLQNDLAAAQKLADDRNAKIAELTTASANLQTKFDEATALNAELRKELQNLNVNVDKLMTEKGNLNSALSDAKTRLDELRKAQAASERRAQLFHDLISKFKKLVEAGDLKIGMRDGRLVLQLPNDVLFDSGKTDIKPQGKAAIEQVANAFKSIKDRRFQIAGHTDNVPIRFGRFRSNWELSTARALEVVHLLIEAGVDPKFVSAAGHGEFDPIAQNEGAGKAKNRRIEITLQPNIDELISVPEIK